MLYNFLKKAGGFSLIKNYIYNHVFLYACFLFLILPKDRIGLETLNECITYKIYLRLKKKYEKKIAIYENKEKNEKPKIVWFCWLQGIENAPALVKKVLESIKNNLKDYKVVILTSTNFTEYTNIPSFIIEKWNKGIISNTHFSDILRTNVLINNGGTWIDSTALLTDKIPEDIEKSRVFFFRTFKPGSSGHIINSSSWFISAEKENPILKSIQDLVYQYWRNNNKQNHYFLFHMCTEMFFSKYPELMDEMPEYSNENPHFLFYELNKDYNIERYNMIKNQCFIHKLSNKVKSDDYSSNSFYTFIMNN